MKNIVVTTPFELEELISDAVKNALKNLNNTSGNNANQKEVYTIRQACHYLNVSRSTIQRYREEGRLKGTKLDGKVLFRKEDLDTFLKANKEG